MLCLFEVLILILLQGDRGMKGACGQDGDKGEKVIARFTL